MSYYKPRGSRPRAFRPRPSFSALQANKRYELECLDRLIAGVQTREGLLGAGDAPLMLAPDA